ncbi:hypothetical protein NEF87_002048 [Candidatus Lokiarchaeum ossiferum]|uniref:histidine kinase n=1 Tax=Candidatus Lokiarchaeum ossiferum TaxID=2951803 RepID=A0ABY6HQI1_9ARCH|nr:hypothetical protein NEF87_002048 [Candidatus Lokiarchaeum sp. B-35]
MKFPILSRNLGIEEYLITMHFRLSKVGLKSKILVYIVFVSIIPMVAVSIESSQNLQNIIFEEKRTALKAHADICLSQLNYTYSQFLNGAFDNESEAQKSALSAIREFRYGKDFQDYFWIQGERNETAFMIMHPYFPGLADDLETEMSEEANLVMSIALNEVNEVDEDPNEGFIEYDWPLYNDSTVLVPKLSFIKHFLPWNWVVGTGVYIDDVDIIVRSNLIDRLIFIFSIYVVIGTVIVVLIWRDLHERDLAQKSKLRLTKILETTSDLVAMATTDLKISFINKAGRNLIGLAEDEDISSLVIPNFHPPEVSNYIKETLIPIAIQKGMSVGETRLLTKKMQEIPVSQVIMAHKNPKGKLEYLSTIIRDISDLKNSETTLKQALHDKDVLLREIHHRVKNNLQIISSLIRLQKPAVDLTNVKQFNQDFQNRIRTMSLLHEILYNSSDFEIIYLDEYVNLLVKYLQDSYPENSQNVTFQTIIDPIEIDLSQAISCGLIINEIISNSIKYAFPNGEKGVIEIKIWLENKNEIYMEIRDYGKGINPKINFPNDSTLGLQLIAGLTNQLNGTVSLDRENGTCYKIEFKKSI